MAERATSYSQLKVLHLLLEASEEEFGYNELCVARADSQEIGICTFFGSKATVPPTLQLFEGDGSFRGFFASLQRALSDCDYDLVHAHSPHVGCLLLLWKLANWRELPPTVFTVQHSYTNSNLKTRNRLLDLLVFATFDRIVLVSEAAKNSFPAVYRRVAGRRLDVVPHAADLARIDRTVGRFSRASSRGFSVACVGRLIPIKNPATVLEAFLDVRSPTMSLVFIGEGEEAGLLDRRAAEAGAVESVILTGLIPRKQVYETLARADLFVSASLGEGMPVAVLEAMACGCPVVLSDIPPHREIAVAADFIPVFPPDDQVALARQITRFWKMAESDRREIGRRCRELIETRYSLSTIHARYDAIYREVARNRR